MKIRLLAVVGLTALLAACSGGGRSTVTPPIKTDANTASATSANHKSHRFLLQQGMAPNGHYVAKYVLAPGQDPEADARIGADQQAALRSNVYHATQAEIEQMNSPRRTAESLGITPAMVCANCSGSGSGGSGGTFDDLGFIDAFSSDPMLGTILYGGVTVPGGAILPTDGQDCSTGWHYSYVTQQRACGFFQNPPRPNIFFDESFSTYGQCTPGKYRYSYATSSYSLNACPEPTVRDGNGVYNNFPTFAYQNLTKSPILPIVETLQPSFGPIGATFSVFVETGVQYNFTNLNVIMAEQQSTLPKGIFNGGGQSIGALIVSGG